MLRLKNKDVTSIQASKMKDGEIAVITSWGVHGYVGNIVQRYHNNLVMVGKESGWRHYFDGENDDKENQVRLLQKGEILIVD